MRRTRASRLALCGLIVVIACALASCSPRPAPAAGEPEAAPAPLDGQAVARAEAAIARAIDDGLIPGAVLVMGDSNGVRYLRAFGHRRLEPKPEFMTPDTVFDLASLTKAVATAASVMKLAEWGKVDLDAPAARYLPSFGAAGKEAITVRQLLLHRSGLTPDNALADYADGRDRALERIDALRPRWDVGAGFHYSDVGYIVLGRLVERVSGVALDVFAHRELFEPMGMDHARFMPPEAWAGRIAPTAKENGQWLVGCVHDPRARALGGVAGHAGLFASAGDLARFCRMVLGGGRLDGRRVLAPETVATWTRIHPFADGARTCGFDADTGLSSARGGRFARRRTFGHTGFTGTMLWIDPEHGVFVVLLTNRLHAGSRSVVPLYREVSTAAAEALLGPEGVRTGIDVLVRDGFSALDGRRVGLITNHTGIDARGRSTASLLAEAENVTLVALFSPEHGLAGGREGTVGDAVDEATGLPVRSLYGETRRPTAEMLEGLDTLVFDIQDVGTRFYTYISTMANAMEAAGEHGLRFVVLDRPNPIAPLGVDGPLADRDRLSFTACRPLPLTHGMTVGELARLFVGRYGIACDLRVVTMEGYTHALWFDQTGQPWVDPSPNMRNPTQAVLYPAVGLLEMTNLSVGRGTDEPFERLGAPWIDGRELARWLNDAALPGLRFVPIAFTPDASRYKGERCEGVHIIVTDRSAVAPARTGLTLAWTLRRLYTGEFRADAVLTLLANRAVQRAWPDADDPAALAATWADPLAGFRDDRARHLLYP